MAEVSAFATAAQVEERTQGEIPATTPGLANALAAATSAIRDYCRWHVAPSEQHTTVRGGPFSNAIWLPASEIASIDEAVVDGVTLDNPGSIDFDPLTGWTPLCGRRYRVTYTAGFDDVPGVLVGLCVELAVATLLTSGNITQEQAGAVSLTYTRTSGALRIGPDGVDAATLAPYRLGVLP